VHTFTSRLAFSSRLSRWQQIFSSPVVFDRVASLFIIEKRHTNTIISFNHYQRTNLPPFRRRAGPIGRLIRAAPAGRPAATCLFCLVSLLVAAAAAANNTHTHGAAHADSPQPQSSRFRMIVVISAADDNEDAAAADDTSTTHSHLRQTHILIVVLGCRLVGRPPHWHRCLAGAPSSAAPSAGRSRAKSPSAGSD
jgi:hypothetical protein